MKLFLALGGLLLVTAVPAQAQLGGGAGGGSIGHVSFPAVLSIPPTQFNSTVVSGSAQDFVPTSYVSFDQGVEQGLALLAAKHKSVAEVAEENNRAARPKAKVAFVQSDDGAAMITRR